MIRRIIALCLLILFVCTNHTTASLLAPLTTSAPTHADNTNTVISGINNTIKHWNYSISDDTSNTSIRTYDGNLSADQRIAPTLLVEENASADTVASSGDVVVSGNTNTSNPLTQLHVESISAQTIQSGYISTGTIGSRIIKDGSLTQNAIDKKQIQVPLSGTCDTNYYLHTLPADGIIDNARHCKPLPTNNTVNICETQPTHPCCNNGTRNCPLPSPTCGNNIVEPGETCDEGKTCENGTACTSEEQCGTPVTQEICTTHQECKKHPLDPLGFLFNPICEDVQKCTKEIVYGELCKVRDTPTCDASCNSLQTYCGDGEVQKPNEIGTNGPNNDGNEECDDGNSNNNDTCTNSCTLNTGCYNKDMSQHTAYPTVTKVWIPQQGRYTLTEIDRTSPTITIQGRTDLKNYFGPNIITNPNYISGGLTALYGKAHINANGAHASYSCVTDTTGIDLEDDSYRFFVEGGDNLPTSAYASGQEYGQSTPVFDATYPGLLSGALSGTAVFADARTTRQSRDVNYTHTQPSDAVQVSCEVFNEGFGCRQKETTEFYYTYDWQTEKFSCLPCGALKPLSIKIKNGKKTLITEKPDLYKKECYQEVFCRRSDGLVIYQLDKEGKYITPDGKKYNGPAYCSNLQPEKNLQLQCDVCDGELYYRGFAIKIPLITVGRYNWRRLVNHEGGKSGCDIDTVSSTKNTNDPDRFSHRGRGPWDQHKDTRKYRLHCPDNSKIMFPYFGQNAEVMIDTQASEWNKNPYTNNISSRPVKQVKGCKGGILTDVDASFNIFVNGIPTSGPLMCSMGYQMMYLAKARDSGREHAWLEAIGHGALSILSFTTTVYTGIVGLISPIGISEHRTPIKYACDPTPEFTVRYDITRHKGQVLGDPEADNTTPSDSSTAPPPILGNMYTNAPQYNIEFNNARNGYTNRTTTNDPLYKSAHFTSHRDKMHIAYTDISTLRNSGITNAIPIPKIFNSLKNIYSLNQFNHLLYPPSNPCYQGQFTTGCVFDSDKDGIADSIEGQTTDTDGDTIPNYLEHNNKSSFGLNTIYNDETTSFPQEFTINEATLRSLIQQRGKNTITVTGPPQITRKQGLYNRNNKKVILNGYIYRYPITAKITEVINNNNENPTTKIHSYEGYYELFIRPGGSKPFIIHTHAAGESGTSPIILEFINAIRYNTGRDSV